MFLLNLIILNWVYLNFSNYHVFIKSYYIELSLFKFLEFNVFIKYKLI